MKAVQNKNFAIVGAGPGGLTLARLLQMRGVEVTVHERDSSDASRNQGATLDLHHDSGLAALQAAGLMDAFRANYRPGADSLLIANEKADVLYVDPSSQGHAQERPEIDRGPLRSLLIDSLEPGTVRWGQKIEGVVAQGARLQLLFEGGDEVVADCVIAADGANSRLRRFVTPIRPAYSGVTVVEGNIADAAKEVPELVAMLRGQYRAVLALGGEKSLAAGIKGDGTATFYCGLKAPVDWANTLGLDASSAAARLRWFHETYRGWSSFWDPLFEHTRTLTLRPQYVCPFDQRWDGKPNMTLIGDAAHVMPPYAGEGVNMAMLDALVLSQELLSDGCVDVHSAILAYESEMFLRTSAVAKLTMENTEIFHSPDASSQLIAMFQGFSAERAASESPVI